VEYQFPPEHSLKICGNLNIIHGDIKENVRVCFFLNTVYKLTLLLSPPSNAVNLVNILYIVFSSFCLLFCLHAAAWHHNDNDVFVQTAWKWLTLWTSNFMCMFPRQSPLPSLFNSLFTPFLFLLSLIFPPSSSFTLPYHKMPPQIASEIPYTSSPHSFSLLFSPLSFVLPPLPSLFLPAKQPPSSNSLGIWEPL